MFKNALLVNSIQDVMRSIRCRS